jgi:hypothetical protein
MPVDVANFSDLINKPKDTLAGLSADRASAVRLHRRGGDADLVLTTAERYDRDQAVMGVVGRLLSELLRDLDSLTDTQLRRVMRAAFAWSTFLDDEDLRDFANELTNAMRAAAELNNFAPTATVIAAWRHSAEILADPGLTEAVTRPATDHGVISPPERVA